MKASKTNKQCKLYISPDSECQIRYYNDSDDNYILVRQNGQYIHPVLNHIYQDVTLFINTNKLIFTIKPKHMSYPECMSIPTENAIRSFIFEPGVCFYNYV